jgi:chromosome segregation ATPase
VRGILEETNNNTQIIAELSGQQKEIRTRVNEIIDEVKVKSNKLKEQLDGISDQVEKTNFTIEDRAVIKNQLASQSHSISVFQEQANKLAELANTVQQLNAAVTVIATKAQVDTSALAKAPSPQAISTSLTEANTGLSKPIVFLQFSGAVTRPEIQQISAELKERGFRVPGEERVAGPAREVRYFYPDDGPVADDLARKTTDLLRERG